MTDALRRVDYRVNSLAQSLKRQQTFTLGQILQSTFPNTFYVQVALGAERYAQARGYNVLTYNVHGSLVSEHSAVENFLRWHVDAILFITPIRAENVQLALGTGTPVVQVERPVLQASDQVLVDNYLGASAAMEHLIGLNHRDVAFIGQDPKAQLNSFSAYVERERLSAYRDSLLRNNLPVEDKRIALGSYYSLHDRGAHEDGYRATEVFLRQTPRPTAIFTSSDILAAGVLQCLYTYRLRVPEDISVVGFDDTYSAFVSPMLTTVRIPMERLGMTAVQVALERLKGLGAHEDHMTEKLPTELVVRDSTGPAP